MTDKPPQDDQKNEGTKVGSRKTLADDLIRAEFAELSRAQQRVKAKLSKEAGKSGADDIKSKPPSKHVDEVQPKVEDQEEGIE